jgi:hypothetical protein
VVVSEFELGSSVPDIQTPDSSWTTPVGETTTTVVKGMTEVVVLKGGIN